MRGGLGVLVSTSRFYFGTFVPHRPLGGGKGDRPEGFGTLGPRAGRARALLECLNFGCHAEHHASPRTPWWRLYDLHIAATRAAGA